MPGDRTAGRAWAATPLYIGFVVALSVSLGALCAARSGWPRDWVALVVLAFLGVLTWWLPSTSSDGRLRFTADSVVLLVAISIVGPLGAGIVGFTMAALERRRIPLYRRLFNVAMSSTSAMIGGLSYELAGGSLHVSELHGTGPLALHVGLPILVANAANLLTNAVLVAGVIRISAGVPMRHQLADMLMSSGLTQFAYGIIAFLVVVMWQPGRLGPVALLVGLAPLAGARWALMQYGEEREARERAFGALVAAIETRAPELEGHSARVSALAATMAQDLGLGPKEVADVRTAGMLHDLGRVVVAPGHETVDAERGASRRGTAMLQGLPFLSGATDLMHQMASDDPSDVTSHTLAAQIVSAADEYDLSVHGPEAISAGDALARVASRLAGAETERVLASLSRAIRADKGAALETGARA